MVAAWRLAVHRARPRPPDPPPRAQAAPAKQPLPAPMTTPMTATTIAPSPEERADDLRDLNAAAHTRIVRLSAAIRDAEKRGASTRELRQLLMQARGKQADFTHELRTLAER